MFACCSGNYVRVTRTVRGSGKLDPTEIDSGMWRDGDEALNLIHQDQELGEEVFSAEDRHADVAKAGREFNLATRDYGLERMRGKMVVGEPIACVDLLNLAVVKLHAQGLGKMLREHRSTGPAIRQHPEWEEAPSRRQDFDLNCWKECFPPA